MSKTEILVAFPSGQQIFLLAKMKMYRKFSIQGKLIVAPVRRKQVVLSFAKRLVVL